MRVEWAPVNGYETLYEVSNRGAVRGLYRKVERTHHSAMTKFPRLLAQTPGGRGFLTVTLSRDGHAKNFYVHRLVASVFVDNPNGFKFVRHLNGNRMDNRAANLQWTKGRGIRR